MKNRAVVFASALVAAIAVSAGLAALVSPFGSAEAQSTAGPTPPPIGDLLDELAPGAVVDNNADGSISVFGKATPRVQAEIMRARELAAAGPNTIRCDGDGATLQCTAVPDAQVIPALKAGETGLYGRTVYRAITKEAIQRGAAMFESRELVCLDAESDGILTCSSVGHVPPVIRSGQTLFVTYRPWNVSFDDQGVPFVRLGTPTVRLTREAER